MLLHMRHMRRLKGINNCNNTSTCVYICTCVSRGKRSNKCIPILVVHK